MRGTYTSTKTGKDERYDSSYELRRFVALDSSDIVSRWTKRHGITIAYKVGNRRRKYIPDILVEYGDGRVFLEEVKGKVWNRLEFGAKNMAALSYCLANRYTFRIVFGEQLEHVT